MKCSSPFEIIGGQRIRVFGRTARPPLDLILPQGGPPLLRQSASRVVGDYQHVDPVAERHLKSSGRIAIGEKPYCSSVHRAQRRPCSSSHGSTRPTRGFLIARGGRGPAAQPGSALRSACSASDVTRTFCAAQTAGNDVSRTTHLHGGTLLHAAFQLAEPRVLAPDRRQEWPDSDDSAGAGDTSPRRRDRR